MTKRKASDCFVFPSPNTKSRQSCFALPQWPLEDTFAMDVVTSPPIKRVRVLGGDNSHNDAAFESHPYGQCDIPMGSPVQRVPASPRQSVHQPCKIISFKELDAMQSENTMLRDALAALTKELAESRSKIAQLEAQCSQSQQVSRGCLATGFRSPYLQVDAQPMYFAPHQFVPKPQYAQ